MLQVDPTSHVPIYEQIVTQVAYEVAAGKLAVDEPIPSVRQMAADILINPNTIARAYRELQQMQVLEQRRGLGMFVTKQAPKLCKALRADRVRTRLRDILNEAVDSALDVNEIEKIVQQELKKVSRRKQAR